MRPAPNRLGSRVASREKVGPELEVGTVGQTKKDHAVEKKNKKNNQTKNPLEITKLQQEKGEKEQ